jgi:hypothetical protein
MIATDDVKEWLQNNTTDTHRTRIGDFFTENNEQMSFMMATLHTHALSMDFDKLVDGIYLIANIFYTLAVKDITDETQE